MRLSYKEVGTVRFRGWLPNSVGSMGMQRGLINREHPISAPSRFESDADYQD